MNLELELQVGDLVMWESKPTEYSTFKSGVIYQCIDRRSDNQKSMPKYKFRVVFDIFNPLGSKLETIEFTSVRELKKLSLIDLGVMRMMLDNFIKDWSKAQGSPFNAAIEGDVVTST